MVLAFAACRATSVDYGGAGDAGEQGGSAGDAGRGGDESGGQAGNTDSGGASPTGGALSGGTGGASSRGGSPHNGGGGQDAGAAGADDGGSGNESGSGSGGVATGGAGTGGAGTGGGGMGGGGMGGAGTGGAGMGGAGMGGAGTGGSGRPGICSEDATVVPECYANPVGVFPAMSVPAAVGIGVIAQDVSSGIFSAFASKANSPMIAVTWTGEAGAGPWTGWRCFDAVPYPGRVAASSLLNAQPEVFVATNCGELYVRRLIAGVGWIGWSRFSLPSTDSFVTDVALALSEERVNLVYVADRGSVFARHRVGLDTYAAFGPWQALGSSDARVVAAGRLQDGRQMVFVLDIDGQPRSQTQRSADLGAPFDSPLDFDSGDVPELVDIEAAHESRPLEVLAVDRNGALWLRRESGSGGFGSWQTWPGPAAPERLGAIGAAGLPSANGSPLVVFAVGQSGITYWTRRVHDAWDPWQIHY
jgi:hypothetical protein